MNKYSNRMNKMLPKTEQDYWFTNIPFQFEQLYVKDHFLNREATDKKVSKWIKQKHIKTEKELE